jgi:tRNA pseudouridine38-40 synthase
VTRRLALIVEYDGAAYAGWQRQPEVPTVQAVIEDALASLTQTPHRITGAGRTDAGVHALGQVAHLDTQSHLPADRIREGLNALLPRDVVIREVCEVAPDFHARRDARLRVYRYAVLARPRPSALLRGYAHHVAEPLDVDAMRAGATGLTGEHDFAAFRILGTGTTSTVCHVRTLRIEQRGDLLVFTAAANRFLRQMVRRIVGVLLAVGRGGQPPESVAATLASRDNRRTGAPAPAHGLYLVRVLYPAHRVVGPPQPPVQML